MNAIQAKPIVLDEVLRTSVSDLIDLDLVKAPGLPKRVVRVNGSKVTLALPRTLVAADGNVSDYAAEGKVTVIGHARLRAPIAKPKAQAKASVKAVPKANSQAQKAQAFDALMALLNEKR